MVSLARTAARWWRINRALVRASLHTLVQYRSDFWSSLLASAVSAATALVGILIVSANTESLNGWSVAGLTLLLGVHYIVGGVVGCGLAPSLEETVGLIRDGGFDYLVVQPLDPQFHAGARVFRAEALAGVITGAILIVASTPQLEVTPMGVLMFLLTLALGIMCVAGWQYVMAGLAFSLIRVDTLFTAFDQLYEEAGRWPVGVFPLYLRGILTLIFPVLLCVSVPAASLSARGTALLPGSAWILLAVTMGFLLLSRLVWRSGLARYVGGSN